MCVTEADSRVCRKRTSGCHGKYPEVIMDPCLSWTHHVHMLVLNSCSLISKYCYTETLRTIYYALFQSLIHYGIIGLGSADSNGVYPMQLLQKRVFKIIMRQHKRFPTIDLFSSIGFKTFLNHLF